MVFGFGEVDRTDPKDAAPRLLLLALDGLDQRLLHEILLGDLRAGIERRAMQAQGGGRALAVSPQIRAQPSLEDGGRGVVDALEEGRDEGGGALRVDQLVQQEGADAVVGRDGAKGDDWGEGMASRPTGHGDAIVDEPIAAGSLLVDLHDDDHVDELAAEDGRHVERLGGLLEDHDRHVVANVPLPLQVLRVVRHVLHVGCDVEDHREVC